MSVLIKNMEMPKGCIYANDNDQTEYCPLLNHDDVPFCQYIESEPEIAIGIDERPVYCPLSDVPEPCENTVSRQAAIDAVMQYCPDDDGSCSKADRDIRELLDDIENLPSAQPEMNLDEWCTDCKEYDHEKHCCPRWNRVIRQTLSEQHKTGKWIQFPNHMAYKCSECGRVIQTTDGQRNVSKHYPFCHCGADMREKINEQI